jgi:hypothetical protein
MNRSKEPGFADRRSAAATAKKTALERHRASLPSARRLGKRSLPIASSAPPGARPRRQQARPEKPQRRRPGKPPNERLAKPCFAPSAPPEMLGPRQGLPVISLWKPSSGPPGIPARPPVSQKNGGDDNETQPPQSAPASARPAATTDGISPHGK